MASRQGADLESMIPVIQEIRAMHVVTEDINLVKQVGEYLNEKFQQREDLENEMRAELKPLAMKVNAAKLSSQRPANVPTRAQHAQTLDDLDNRRHQLVKAIEEDESIANDRAAEYARLKAELKELNERDVAEEADLDGTAVRLHTYEELGFRWVEDRESEDGPKIVIKSESDAVHLVKLDGSLTEFELKNHLWDLNSE